MRKVNLLELSEDASISFESHAQCVGKHPHASPQRLLHQFSSFAILGLTCFRQGRSLDSVDVWYCVNILLEASSGVHVSAISEPYPAHHIVYSTLAYIRLLPVWIRHVGEAGFSI
jgi:hypothetical protein